MKQLKLEELKEKNFIELKKDLVELNINPEISNEREAVFLIANHIVFNTDSKIICKGIVSLFQEGFGFIRFKESNYLPSSFDVYISPRQISNSSIRNGDTIECFIGMPRQNERFFFVTEILSINEKSIEESSNRNRFEKLTPIHPLKKVNLFLKNETDLTLRIIDLFSPIGFGQRGLIVAPPKTGKTTILQKIAKSIEINHPEAKLIVLLIDERPEEVTDMRKWVKAEVISSTFDEPPSRHIMVAEIVLEKAKRLVENEENVIILLDGITRLSRAYNSAIPSSGRVLSGGVDSNALQKPKRFFGAARNTEEGGSLTIIATALVETGSKMDEVIFEEFKGTGNQDLVLDRKLYEKRVFPCIDINKSGTRKEELLCPNEEVNKMRMLRKITSGMGSVESMEFLIEKMKNTSTNEEFFKLMNGS